MAYATNHSRQAQSGSLRLTMFASNAEGQTTSRQRVNGRFRPTTIVLLNEMRHLGGFL